MSEPDDALLKFLAQHDSPCPGCGYNLRALVTDTCPECGKIVTLKMLAEYPLSAAWWIGLMPLVVLSLPAVPIMAIAGVLGVDHFLSGNAVPGFIALAMSGSCAALLHQELHWLRRADLFVRLPEHEQWRRAKIMWSLAAGCVILFRAMAATT